MIMKLQELRPGIFGLYLPSKIIKGIGWKKGDNIDVTIGGKNKLELSRTEATE